MDLASYRVLASRWAFWTEMVFIEGIPIAICLAFAGRPVRIGLAVIGLFTVNFFMLIYGPTGVVYQNRSYFSVQRVRLETEPELGTYHILMHGGIDHGRQNLDPGPQAVSAMAAAGIPYFHPDNKRDQPISYFFPTNPIGQVFMKLRQMDSKPPFAVVGWHRHNGVVCQTRPSAGYLRNRRGRFAPFRAARRHRSVFPLPAGREKSARMNLHVILGDGRLKIKDAPPKYYQVIVLDAFSSDAIPVHLMTKEAIALYLSKLKDDGMLVFNITNRYVRLTPVLADLAKEFDMVCLQQGDGSDDRQPEKFGTDWCIMFPKPKNVDKMACKAALLLGGLARSGLCPSACRRGGNAGLSNTVSPTRRPQSLESGKTFRPTGLDRHYQNMVPMINWFGWTPDD